MPRFDCEWSLQDADKSDCQPFAYLVWPCVGHVSNYRGVQTLQIMVLRLCSKALDAEICRCTGNDVEVFGSVLAADKCRPLRTWTYSTSAYVYASLDVALLCQYTRLQV